MSDVRILLISHTSPESGGPLRENHFALHCRKHMTGADANTKHPKVNFLHHWMAFCCSLLIFNPKFTQIKDWNCNIERGSQCSVSQLLSISWLSIKQNTPAHTFSLTHWPLLLNTPVPLSIHAIIQTTNHVAMWIQGQEIQLLFITHQKCGIGVSTREADLSISQYSWIVTHNSLKFL